MAEAVFNDSMDSEITTIIGIAEENTTIANIMNTTIENILVDVSEGEVGANATTLTELANSVDVFFLLINGFVIFFLQSGFAFLEAGSVRSKNTTNILIKNMLDVFLAAVAFWVFGYMFAYGKGNGFLGYDPGHLVLASVPVSSYAHWFFQFVFCATAATIVSGSVAERCTLETYFTYSIFLSGVVYPIAVHWAWTEEGWLATHGYTDFAGSGIVHLLGGSCAFVGAVFLGPRIGRFAPDGTPQDMPGHSVPLAALGGFILMFGFFAFNGASEGAVSTLAHVDAVERSVMSTIISGSFSGIGTLIVFRFMHGKSGKWSLTLTINGALTGMIAVCAMCNDIEPYIAAIVGVGAAPVYTLVHHAILKMRIDDPLDAVAVHAGGGLYGVLLTPFVIRSGVFYSSGDGTTNTLHKIWANVVGALVIIGWSTILSSIMFYTLRLKKWLRVSEEMEKHGLDILKHGEPAYPAQAWLEEQYGYHNQNTENGGLEIPTDYHHDKITKHLPDGTQVVCEQHTCWLPQFKKDNEPGLESVKFSTESKGLPPNMSNLETITKEVSHESDSTESTQSTLDAKDDKIP